MIDTNTVTVTYKEPNPNLVIPPRNKRRKRARGTNPRALGTNPRALGTNPRKVNE